MSSTLNTLSPQVSVVAGTPIVLTSSSLEVNSVIIKAHKNNTGRVYLAFNSAGANSTTGFDLQAGDVWSYSVEPNRSILYPINLNQIYIDGDTTGDKVIVQYAR